MQNREMYQQHTRAYHERKYIAAQAGFVMGHHSMLA